jgi:hypothetical protein
VEADDFGVVHEAVDHRGAAKSSPKMSPHAESGLPFLSQGPTDGTGGRRVVSA